MRVIAILTWKFCYLCIISPNFCFLSCKNLQVLMFNYIILRNAGQEIKILFIEKFFKHDKKILLGILFDTTFSTQFEICLVFPWIAETQILFTIEKKSSLSSLTMVIIGSSSTMISSTAFIPFVVALIIMSIIFVLSVIILIPNMCMIHYMLVMLVFKYFIQPIVLCWVFRHILHHFNLTTSALYKHSVFIYCGSNIS